jgi:membrane-associated phospholipid phosphatase
MFVNTNLKSNIMLNKFLLLLVFSLSLQTSIFAQEKKPEITPETKGEKKQEKKLYSLSQFGHETFLFVKQPARWVGSDWIKVGAVVATTTVVSLTLDKALVKATQGSQNYYKSAPIVGGRMYGEWYSIVGVAGAFGVYGMLAKDTASKKISIELFQAGVYSELASTVLKIVVGRARPNITENAYTFHPFKLFHNEYYSMPSGHTTSAMALSTVMSRHAKSTVFKVLAYVPAAFTMFSRIYQDDHWMSDVLPGAAIGFFVGNWVVDLHEGKRHRINVTSVAPLALTISLDKQK